MESSFPVLPLHRTDIPRIIKIARKLKIFKGAFPCIFTPGLESHRVFQRTTLRPKNNEREHARNTSHHESDYLQLNAHNRSECP
jgi:hypothetical protein